MDILAYLIGVSLGLNVVLGVSLYRLYKKLQTRERS